MKTTFSALAEGADISINAAVARELKKEYPIFRTLPNLVYLDNAATTQKPLSVLDAERDFYMQSCANVHRAIHTIGEEATARYEKARSSMARFIGAAPKELIFTRGTTESINLVARTFGETLREGDEIILSVMEHHANMVPWQQLAERRGVVLKFIPVTDLGELDLAEYEKTCQPENAPCGSDHGVECAGHNQPDRQDCSNSEVSRGAGAPRCSTGSAIHAPRCEGAWGGFCGFFGAQDVWAFWYRHSLGKRNNARQNAAIPRGR
jgi:Selenocysteine lyase